MFLFYGRMACAASLAGLIIFTLIFLTVASNHYKSIKSIDNNLYNKSFDPIPKQKQKLSAHYTSKDKRLWRCYNKKSLEIKDRLNFVTFQTERRIVSTTVAQVITKANT